MAEFMETGAVIVDRLVKGRLRRHLDAVEARHIKGHRAARMECRAGRGDQRLGGGHGLAFRQYGGRCKQLARQAVALRDIENGEALEKGNAPGLLAFRRRAFPFRLGREAVGINEGHALLALADMAAKRKRLPEGEPVLGGEAALDDGAPEDQDIDPRIGIPRRRIARQTEPRFRFVPGLHPRHAARFELRDDFCRHIGIKLRPRLPPGLTIMFSAHRPAPVKTRRVSPGSGMGGEKRPEGPPSEAGRTEGRNEVEDPERKRRVAACRGGPRRERRPSRVRGRHFKQDAARERGGLSPWACRVP